MEVCKGSNIRSKLVSKTNIETNIACIQQNIDGIQKSVHFLQLNFITLKRTINPTNYLPNTGYVNSEGRCIRGRSISQNNIETNLGQLQQNIFDIQRSINYLQMNLNTLKEKFSPTNYLQNMGLIQKLLNDINYIHEDIYYLQKYFNNLRKELKDIVYVKDYIDSMKKHIHMMLNKLDKMLIIAFDLNAQITSYIMEKPRTKKKINLFFKFVIFTFFFLILITIFFPK
jgi:prefoldin subunit 5